MLDQRGGVPYRTIALSLIILAAAIVPRVYALDVFITPDEYRWVDRSTAFLRDLLTLSPKAAFADGFPGVTTRWAGSMGLLLNYSTQNYGARTPLDPESEPPDLMEFLDKLIPKDFSLLPLMRLPIALITSVCIAILYLLSRRLFGEWAALAAAVLLVSEPFLIGLSRVIHHDALVASFGGVAVLSLLVYLGEERPRARFLALSGVAAGLALLSKATAVFLFPYAAFITAFACLRWEARIPRLDRTRILRALAILAAWGLLAVITVVALWPAMWVDPRGTLNEFLGLTTQFATTPHRPGNYFLGQPVGDPGKLFYWLAFLFRTTPLTLLGLLATPLLLQVRTSRDSQQRTGLQLFGLWSFILLFLVFMSFGTKKLDRYSLPAILLADVLAGAGLVSLLGLLKQGLQKWQVFTPLRARWLTGGLAVAAVLVLRGFFLWPHVPYYLSYYNLLLGGNNGAVSAIMIGWGEGCDIAARYLNQKDHAEDLNVAAWYQGSCFGPLFDGTAWDIGIEDLNQRVGLPWYTADYVVIYVNQVQREIPNKELNEFFLTQEPEYVARIAGCDYAWVYAVPENIPESVLPASRCPVYKVPAGNFDNQVQLGNYAIGGPEFRTQATFAAGETVNLALRWHTKQPLASHHKVFAHVYDSQGRLVTQADDWLGSIYMSHELLTRSSGKIMNYMELTIPPATPPGDYTLAVGLYDPTTGQRLSQLDDDGKATGTVVTLSTLSVARPTTPPSIAELSIQHGPAVKLPSGLTLLGYDLQPAEGRAGEPLSVALYWQAQRDGLADLLVALQLRDAAGEVWGYHASPPADGTYPTSGWIAGEIVRDVHDLTVDATVPPGNLHLVLLLSGTETPLGTVPIVGRQHVFEPPTVSHPQTTDLEGVRFLGYDLPSTTVRPGEPINLTLYWNCQNKLQTSYKLFVHLIDDQYGTWGQVDRVPCDGECPTTGWLPDEYLVETYQLVPKSETPPGTYRITIGLYDEQTGARLPRADGSGDHILLDATITVQGE